MIKKATLEKLIEKTFKSQLKTFAKEIHGELTILESNEDYNYSNREIKSVIENCINKSIDNFTEDILNLN